MQLVEQRLSLQALRKPAVHWSEQFASLLRLPWRHQKRAMLIAERSFQDFACWLRATASARSKYVSALAASGSGDINANSPVMRLTSASHILSRVVSTAIIASLMLRQEFLELTEFRIGSGQRGKLRRRED